MHRADHPLHRLVGTGGDIGRHLAAQVRHLALRGRHDLVQLRHLVRLVGQFRLIDHGSILADAHRSADGQGCGPATQSSPRRCLIAGSVSFAT